MAASYIERSMIVIQLLFSPFGVQWLAAHAACPTEWLGVGQPQPSSEDT